VLRDVIFPQQIEQLQQGGGSVKRESPRKRKRVRGVDGDDNLSTSSGNTHRIALDTQLGRVVFSILSGSGELPGKQYDVSVEGGVEVEKDVGEDRVVFGGDGIELGGMEVRMWGFC
jgi:hypothetical protein